MDTNWDACAAVKRHRPHAEFPLVAIEVAKMSEDVSISDCEIPPGARQRPKK